MTAAAIYVYQNVGVSFGSASALGRVVGFAALLNIAAAYVYQNVEDPPP